MHINQFFRIGNEVAHSLAIEGPMHRTSVDKARSLLADIQGIILLIGANKSYNLKNEYPK
jgi:hypothetical protein